MESIIGYIKLVHVFDYILAKRSEFDGEALSVISQARQECTAQFDANTLFILHDTFCDSERMHSYYNR